MGSHIVYLCLGGNIGDRLANLEETRMFVGFNIGDIEQASGIYESEAWGMDNAPAFLNQVIRVKTDLSLREVMEEVKEMEDFFGRERSPGKYLDREMDVDILFYDDVHHSDDKLEVPHPRLQLRRFVLTPLAEIAPEFVHPVIGKPVAVLLTECTDENKVTLIHAA